MTERTHAREQSKQLPTPLLGTGLAGRYWEQDLRDIAWNKICGTLPGTGFAGHCVETPPKPTTTLKKKNGDDQPRWSTKICKKLTLTGLQNKNHTPAISTTSQDGHICPSGRVVEKPPIPTTNLAGRQGKNHTHQL